ncbi:MAG: Hpt domain-containing protein, partial [Gammaproteobacteria bacterium]|nr:Hpt domain-containing protein [Gammaproteobacteria bacterium]
MSIDLEMEEILKVFFEEGSECLSAMESGLLTLDAHADRETINTIFRAAHSIKGGAGTFGLMEISHFTHAVETLLDQMRNGTRAVSAEAVQVLLQSVDVIREMLDAAAAKQPIPAASAAAVTAQLEQLLATAAPPVEASPPPAAAAPSAAAPSASAPLVQAPPAEPALPAPGLGWRIEFRPDASLFKTCNDPLRMFAQLSMLGELKATPHLHALPGFDELDPTLCLTSWTLILLGPMERTQVEEIFDWVDANSAIEIEPLDPASAP